MSQKPKLFFNVIDIHFVLGLGLWLALFCRGLPKVLHGKSHFIPLFSTLQFSCTTIDKAYWYTTNRKSLYDNGKSLSMLGMSYTKNWHVIILFGFIFSRGYAFLCTTTTIDKAYWYTTNRKSLYDNGKSLSMLGMSLSCYKLALHLIFLCGFLYFLKVTFFVYDNW